MCTWVHAYKHKVAKLSMILKDEQFQISEDFNLCCEIFLFVVGSGFGLLRQGNHLTFEIH